MLYQCFEKASASRATLYSLDQLGGNSNLNEDAAARIRRLIRTMLYDGKENESYVETRIRMCNKLDQNIWFAYH